VFARLLVLLVAAAFLVGVVVHPSSGAGRERAVLVRPGDTLWSIAARSYGGDPREGVWKIARRNHLRGSTVYPGERLVVPSG
jgi:nucleoid-associated protein YgaU